MTMTSSYRFRDPFGIPKLEPRPYSDSVSDGFPNMNPHKMRHNHHEADLGYPNHFRTPAEVYTYADANLNQNL